MKEQKEPAEYKIVFTMAEDLPDEDSGSHNYRIIEGTRYRIDCNPILLLQTNRNLRRSLESYGLEEIRKHNSGEERDPIIKLEMVSKWDGWFGLLNKLLVVGDKYL